MSFLLANGLIEVVVPVGQKICVTSYGAGTTKVESEIGPNNYPIAFSLLKLITNSDYTSPVFTKETIVKITAGLCDVEYIVGINPFPTISRVTTDNNGSFLLEDNTVIDGNLSVSGLLGLGVTPSAWGAAIKALQVNTVAALSASVATLDLTNNCYFDGTSNRYLTTNFATAYTQVAGQHRWSIAPSGTAGNAISFYTALTLSGTDAASTLFLGRGFLTQGAGYTGAGSSTADPYIFYTNSVERARITSDGNLLVGTTMDSGAKLRVDNPSASTNDVATFVTPDATAYLQIVRTGAAAQATTIAAASDSLRFGIDHATGRTERARITYDGNLLVGTTNAAGFRFRVSSSSETVALFDSAGPAAYINISDSTSTNSPQVGSAGNNLVFRTGQASNAERARITSDGNQIYFQPAESSQNTSATLTVSQLQSQIITANAAVTLTLPTGTALETYTTGMAVNTAFEVVFIATTANAITIAANGNTTVGSLTINGNTSGTFCFRKTAANTFTVYRTA